MTKTSEKVEPLGLRPIRCSSCGWFLGGEKLLVGVIRLKCKNCKMWTTVLGEEGWGLTNEEEEAWGLTNEKEGPKLKS